MQVCDGDLGLALEYLLAECFALNNTEDNGISPDEMEEIIELRNDEMLALQAIYDEKFCERVPNRVWILKISLPHLDKKLQPKNDRKKPVEIEGNREICRFYQKGFCRFGKRCRHKHSKPEDKNAAKSIGAVDKNMLETEYEVEIRFPTYNCYPREAPFLAFSSTSSLLDKHICLNITKHMMNEAKKIAESLEPSVFTVVSLLDDETFIDSVVNEAPHEFSCSVNNSLWLPQQTHFEYQDAGQSDGYVRKVLSEGDSGDKIEDDSDVELAKATDSMIKMSGREGKAAGKRNASEDRSIKVNKPTSKEEVKKQNPAELLKTNRKLKEDFKRKKVMHVYK